MKVVTAKTMAEIESLAYKEGLSESDFMEKAGQGIAHAVHNFFLQKKNQAPDKRILLLCGKGNNAGDAFVAGRHLIDQGYIVDAIQLDPLDCCSSLCQLNAKRFLNRGGRQISFPVENCSHYSVLIDGIFGTGFKGHVTEPYARLIQWANQSKLPILAIDIPSGLNGSTGEADDTVIHATQTIFLGLPKTGFFLQNGWNVTGKLEHVDFGLPARFIDNASASFIMMTENEAAKRLQPITRNHHKYQRGQVIGLSGSPGMPGASLLSSLAALRGGCGMMRLLHPQGMQAELSASPYELIKIPYSYDRPQEVLNWMQKGNATFIGPGLGHTEQVGHLLKMVMPHLEKPCVIDADALTLFAENAFEMPKQAILTPHTGEMQRLLHRTDRLSLTSETLQICQKYADDQNVCLILKGAPTFIFHPGEMIYVNPTGDPGMATAGSGDILTGLLASLLAQGLSRHQAALLGVYLHGLAGEYAARVKTSYSVIAGDLIEHFSDAYRMLIGSF